MLDGKFTIGVNRIFLRYSPTVLFWVDRNVYEENKAAFAENDSIQVCGSQNKQRQWMYGLKTHVGSRALKHEATATTLVCNGSTGCCAARWALALGCPVVYLLGMEAEYKDGQTDFYGVNVHHHQDSVRPEGRTLVQLRKELGRLKADFGERVLPLTHGAGLKTIAGNSEPIDMLAVKSKLTELLEAERT